VDIYDNVTRSILRTNVSGNTDTVSGGVTATTAGASLLICSNNICGDSPPPTPDGGGGGGGAGAVLAGGLAALFLGGDEDPYLYLPKPDQLEIEGGELAFWADTDMEYVVVNLKDGTAEVQLLTQGGLLKRELTYRDSADGVNHYAWQSGAADNIQSALSVNPRTREYFYTETGFLAGKSYSVKAHGWLERGLPPEMAKESAGSGALAGK
jgi:hypothetical protein